MRADTQDERDERLVHRPYGAAERADEAITQATPTPKARKAKARAKAEPTGKLKAGTQIRVRLTITLGADVSVADLRAELQDVTSNAKSGAFWRAESTVTRVREVRS